MWLNVPTLAKAIETSRDPHIAGSTPSHQPLGPCLEARVLECGDAFSTGMDGFDEVSFPSWNELACKLTGE